MKNDPDSGPGEATTGAAAYAQQEFGDLAADTIQNKLSSRKFSDPVSRGWATFPLPARSKRPEGLWAQYRDDPVGVDLAKTLDGTDKNVAIITGPQSGLVVLDLDGPEAERTAEQMGFVAPTYTVATGRGKHLYYQYPDDFKVQNGAGKLADHVDIRANGGYVVGAGSIHPDGGAYTVVGDILEVAPLPPALAAALRPATPGRRSGGNRSDTPPADAEFATLCRELSDAKEGTRNAEANRIAFRVGQIVAASRIQVGDAEDRLREICEEIGLEHEEIDHILPRVIEEGMAQPRNSDGEEPMSQVAMARFWRERHGERRRFDHTSGRWRHAEPTSGLWRADECQATFHEIGATVHEVGGGAARYSSSGFISGVEKLAAALPQVATTHEAFDRDPYMLGTPSGPVDLRTGALLPPDPSLLISKSTSTAPKSGTPARYLDFLHQTTGGDEQMIEFLQRVLGYMLTGLTNEQALFFVYGDGGNGKGVFINTARRIMGDYAVTSAMETFTVSRNDRHTTELAMLRGARAVMASETEKGKRWAESRIKQLTGNDEITARFMRQDNFSFTPEFKLLIIGNFHPTLDTVDDAMRRRFNIIPFTRRPTVVNPRLEQELEAEFPQILNWMIEGCIKWQQSGLQRPQAVVDATADYFEEQDVFGQWLEEFCTTGPEHRCATNDLFHNWSLFADDAKEDAGSIKGFGSLMSKRGFVPGRETGGGRLRFWKGLKLQIVVDPGTGVERTKTPRDTVGVPF